MTERPLQRTSDGEQSLTQSREKMVDASVQNIRWLFAVGVFVFVLMSVLSPKVFLSGANFASMANQFPQVGLLALGILLAMLSGGIDLSMVGIANLSAIIAALLLTRGMSTEAVGSEMLLYIVSSVFVAIAVGIVCGLLNGFLIAGLGITPILATLATMQLFSGIAVIITGGRPIFGMPELFTSTVGRSLLGIPVPLLVFGAVALAIAVLLNRTGFGFKLYMLGTNPLAARFAGLQTVGLQLRTYAIVGGLAALSGLLVLAQTNSAKADYGVSYTLQSILIAVMGGVNPYGGFGKVSGVVLAILILQFLSSGFNILGFNNFLKDFIWGVSLLLVMVIHYIVEHRRQNRPVTTGTV